MLLIVSLLVVAGLAIADEEQKLSWKDDDGLEIKIIKPIKKEKCKIVSQEGDVVDQFYKLTDKDGKEIGSNFGKKPSVRPLLDVMVLKNLFFCRYTFTLGKGQVIEGMDRAMTGMCIGEKRKVTIPGKLGFGKDGRDRWAAISG
ncbi:peptidyl-prolyl cis-trans isomerase, FKBP-type [Teladorsagia circumcincta]|uniref:peptidylprolyl isomerase n=2 Tax=Teladorsagia circumcincta TaxID=45464 RepID=A0A2G9TXZ4_TELCI|nr:peptidyl-prolyl cis-trans isomerase, FKBP-type [Teladorsagia circumcincta]